jgi:Flp pilus assembly protein TadD
LRRLLIVTLAVATGTAPVVAGDWPEAERPYDVTSYGVVHRVAAMERVEVRSAIPFDAAGRTLDLYLPPGSGTRPAPVVVFVNSTGGPYPSWEIYRDWGRLVAAHGMAGAVYTADAADPGASLEAVIATLAARGSGLGVDATRIAIWACSANVTLALPWLTSAAPPAVRAAVLYYGTSNAPVAPRPDLPVYYVLAGRDGAGLIAGIRARFGEAIAAGAPWTMVSAPALTHAFDALDRGAESRRLVADTVEWLVDRLVAPPAPGPEPSPARRALTHVYGAELDRAAEIYGQIVAASPEDAEARRAWATTLARLGRSAEALPALEQLAATRPDDSGLALALGQALVRTGSLERGVAELERAVAGGVSPAVAWIQLAFPAMQRGEPRIAAAEWEAALPAIADAAARRVVLYNLACAWALAGEADRALARLGEAVDAGFGPRATIEADADLAALRADPRFVAILDRAD